MAPEAGFSRSCGRHTTVPIPQNESTIYGPYPTAVTDAGGEVPSSHEVRLESLRGVASDAAHLGVCCETARAGESRARMKANNERREFRR